MHYQDYYKTLGVSRDATAEEIKKSFRKLARKYHPDVSHEKDAEEHMKEVNEAYTVLSDPEKRAAYDRIGQGYQRGQDFQPPPGWDAGFEFSGRGFSPYEATDFSDFFSELFGRMGRGANTHGGRSPARGDDHRAKVYLDLEDAFTGAVRQISLQAPRLDAQGRAKLETRTLNVTIPRGIREGQVIRLAGQGEPSHGANAPGDLLLEVHFNPHPHMKVDGRDIHLELPLAPWEAALGAVISIHMPNGEIKVRIPEGAQSGQQLKVRAKGIPGNPPGNLLLNLQVMLPRADNPKARAIYEQMARELAFNPRQRS